MIEIEYRVVEHYDDGRQEPFGFEPFPVDHKPEVGDLVTLHWIDGREAYRVCVDQVLGTALHVRR